MLPYEALWIAILAIYIGIKGAELLTRIPPRNPQWERDGLPPPEQQQDVLEAIYAEHRTGSGGSDDPMRSEKGWSDPAAGNPSVDPPDESSPATVPGWSDPDSWRHWSTVNAARARMGLWPVAFSEWSGTIPPRAETRYQDRPGETTRTAPPAERDIREGVRRHNEWRASRGLEPLQAETIYPESVEALKRTGRPKRRHRYVTGPDGKRVRVYVTGED